MEVNTSQISGLKPDDAKEKFSPPDFTHPYLLWGVMERAGGSST